MKSTLSQLKQWITNAQVSVEAHFDGISTDTRKIQPGNLFIALKGENFDAHDFLPDLLDKKPSAVLVSRLPENYPLPSILVDDTRLAMGEIARNWRKQFNLPLIGVTGSNGKTTTKEMIASILRVAHGSQNVLATLGNLNNDIGVPTTLFGLEDIHTSAVVELGMNHPGEIDYLSHIAQPTIALVNNAQREHQEFMQSVEAVARENGSVFLSLPDNGYAVFPEGDTYSPLWAKLAGRKNQLTFGLSKQAHVHGQWKVQKNGTYLKLSLPNKSIEVLLKTSGEHNVRNALAAAACTYAAGISADFIAQGLESFVPVNGRLQQKVAYNGAKIIDDTYNANPDSVRAAIDVLSTLGENNVLVLADMGEVGDNAKQFHEEVGNYALEKKIANFFTLGTTSRAASEAYGSKAHHFDSEKSLIDTLRKKITPDMTVLIKGSRFMHMERIVNALVQKEGC